MSPPADPAPPVDIIYLFRHSRNHDREILYSLRSVAENLPFVRKVWIFGDRPQFLTDDTAVAEQVPHEYLAPLLGLKAPVRNDFLMLTLASLIPGVAFDFLRFSDDYIVLAPLTRQQFARPRVLEDLRQVAVRGTTDFQQQLWRTYDILARYGYSGYNFEAHVPQPYNRKIVFEAFMAFRPFLSQERYGGMCTATAIFNYALKHPSSRYAPRSLAVEQSPLLIQNLHAGQSPPPAPAFHPDPEPRTLNPPFAWLADENSKAAFYGRCPSLPEICSACEGKLFLSFDDPAWGQPLETFLAERFPAESRYER